MTRLYVLAGHEPRLEPNATAWALWFAEADRHVARTTLLDGSFVSTVFLGVDHRFAGVGPPILFETAIFVENIDGEGRNSEITARYATWAEAELGHLETVECLTQHLQGARH